MNTPDDRVTFTVRRSHLTASAALLVGFALGVATTVVVRSHSVSRADAAAVGAVTARPELAAGDRPRQRIATDGRPSRGPANARVTLVEFTDYECPFCRQHYSQTLSALHRVFGDSVRYVVRNFPIESIHPNAYGAAMGSECAFEQGKFWEFHDRLFEAPALDTAAVRRIARDLSLDMQRYDRCVASPATRARIDRDVADGAAAGVQGTPAFFINGRMIEGAVPVGVFALAIQQELTATK